MRNKTSFEPAVLSELSRVISDMRTNGEGILEEYGIGGKAKTLLCTIADLNMSRNVARVSADDLVSPNDLLTSLASLIEDIDKAQLGVDSHDTSSKVQLSKLKFSLIEKRIAIIEKMNDITEARNFMVLVKKWFEHRLEPELLSEFISDMENIRSK